MHLRRWCLCIALLFLSQTVFARGPFVQSQIETIALSSLPQEAAQTLAAVRRGPPYPYKKDGVVFGNYQKLLPKQQRGYYHEFTVKTPGLRHRGPQRLVIGGDPATSTEIYYTADHYASFFRIRQ